MATRLVNRRLSDANDATFRAWVQDIHDALAAFGWIQTADTGQINIATAIAPTSNFTTVGYEIWRMNDALQATAPIYIRIDYGNNQTVPYAGGLINVGTGSDGAGSLTGKTTGSFWFGMGADQATASDCHYSGDTNRFNMCWNSAAGVPHYLFSIERTKDVNGADTNEGFLMTSIINSTGNPSGNYCALIFGVNGAQAKVPFDTYSIAPFGPMANNVIRSANDGTNVGVHPFSIPSRRGSEQPGLAWVTYWMIDFAPLTLVTVNIYGADHTYITLGSTTSGNGLCQMGQGTAVNGQLMLMMRYE